jgi:hypothetical protein
MFKDKIEDIYEYTNWPADPLISKGFTKFKESRMKINDEYEIYESGENDNVTNFKNRLSTYYRETFIEIICETSFTESCYNLTEKTINSIYGCCFPILLCGKGSVQLLRDIGFDVFDDVINHEYDKIEDPKERLYKAIFDNREILSKNEYAKKIWRNNSSRFQENINVAKNKLYTFYKNRTEQHFKLITNDLNL